MKNVFFGAFFALYIFSCSKNISLNNGFIHYLKENKQNISIYLVNEEATGEFNKIFHEYGEDIFDENGGLIENYTIPDKILGYYEIKDNWEETFFAYMVLHENEINIGEYISKITKRESETGILVTCLLDPEGNKIFRDFTANNIRKSLAIVLNNKIIAVAMILMPLENSITFGISY